MYCRETEEARLIVHTETVNEVIDHKIGEVTF